LAAENTVDISQLFLSTQKKLAASLQAGRDSLPHPSAKGDAAELDWLGMLTAHLPARYTASKAFVLDCKGAVSDQIDVVVHDRQYSPLLFNHNEQLFLPAESVYAVFEVKQDLDKGTVEYAREKAASVRLLHRTTTAIPHAGGTYKAKEPLAVLAGLLSLDSSWSPPLGQPLEQHVCALPAIERLDLGCILMHGAFEALYPSSQGEEITFRRSTPGTALIAFFLCLLRRLQALGTVPAIDLEQYAKALK
jgi:hypothetical protein